MMDSLQRLLTLGPYTVLFLRLALHRGNAHERRSRRGRYWILCGYVNGSTGT